MIDIDYIKSKIYPKSESESERKIGTEDIITQDLVMLFRGGLIGNAPKCFKPIVGNEKFKVVAFCNECKKELLIELSKTKLLKYLHPEKYKSLAKDITCTDCYKIQQQKKLEQSKKEKENIEKIIQENTQYYITNYLTPGYSWKDGVKLKEKKNSVIYFNYMINNKAVYNFVNELTYTDFLNTPYWNAISLYAKSRFNFKCQLCNSEYNLQTHHRTYERHGYEHYLEVIKEDLIVLCDECHKKFHNITEEKNEQ